MKQKTLLVVALGVAAVLSAQTVFGAGFGIYEGSARGNAMATEVTADPASPSVIYNNAAAMTELEGTQMEAGVTLIRPHVTVRTETQMGAVESKADSRWWTPPHAYVTHQINDRLWGGLGVFSRFGLGVDHGKDWAGRYNCQEATIQSIDINPSVAYKVLDNFSLAAGVRAEWFEFKLDQAIPTGTPFVDPDLQFHMKGDSWGVGYNAGAFLKATEWLSVGAAYESKIKQEVEGTYHLSHPNPAVARGDGEGEIKTPQILRLGASVKATDRLTVNAGIVYTMWSSYKALTIDFDPPLLGAVPQKSTEKRWKDVFRYQVGAEYAINESWAVRGGYLYDETPIRGSHVDYIVPANNRHLFSAGVGYKKDNFFCDAGYTYLMIVDRTVEGRQQDGVLSGKFKDGDAHMIGVSVGYKL
ncbi:MAG: transporter [Lentisphaerae bacterium]|jgi:long-chain fatty acid transport protein|nr:transporter [Lentisphaerota bacterium]